MSNIFYKKGITDDWSTPSYIYDYFCKDLGFIDPCKLYELNQRNNIFNDFGDVDLYVNPPYSKLRFWIEYCIFYHRLYKNKIVMLIPVRADTIGFHLLLNYGCDFYFVKGRLKFGDSNNNAPFASMFVVLTGSCSKMFSIKKNEIKKITFRSL